MKHLFDSTKLTERLSYAAGAIISLLPFHAFLTTWLGSNIGHLDVFRIWKELLIVVLAVPTVVIAMRSSRLRRWLRTDKLPLLILIYTLLYLSTGLLALRAGRVNGPALIYAWLANLRFLCFFLVLFILSSQSSWLEKYWRRLVLIPAFMVVLFGCLQAFVLPYDFLRHFGYGPKTIPAYQTIDNKIDYRRIQSTLRGANPLGAYLVLVSSAVLMWWSPRRRQQFVLFGLTLVALFFSYSRSAWLGNALAIGVLVYLAVRLQRRRVFVLASVVVVAVLGTVMLSYHRNKLLQNAVFHTDSSSRSQESSNAGRLRALKVGFREVVHEPLGRGPGSAGPESFRNNHLPRIAENYYLQIGQEVGWLGIVLFAAINWLVGWQLWRRRRDPLARMLFASLIGLTFVNLLSHAWADDTLGLLWWGLAGIALGSVIRNPRASSGNAILHKSATLYARHKHEATKKADARS